jgi:hypothetical protein
VIYSLLIDDVKSPDESRHAARERINKVLTMPLEPEAQKQATEEAKREEWGLTPDAVAAARRDKDFWAQNTFRAS